MNRFFSSLIKNKPLIEITEKAWVKIIDITEKASNKIFLFSTTSGGCNGFNYNLELVNKTIIKKSEKISYIENKNNKTKIFIEPYSEIYLLGTTIDFVSENFEKGIFENKFVFIPDKNSAYSCGCGKSFTLKD